MMMHRLSLAAVAAALLGACSEPPAPTPDAAPEPPDPAVLARSAYDDLLTSVRASPDHLIARAERAVAAQDVMALVALVRDDVLTYPGIYYDASQPDDVRWGPRATLRGGAGTPREKADLLVQLLREAGVAADVIRVDFSGELRDSLLGQSRPAFAPAPLPAGSFARAAFQPPDELVIADEGGRDSRALADQLHALAPPEDAAVFDTYVTALPAVAFELDGEQLYVVPALRDSEPTPVDDGMSLEPLEAASYEQVTVRLTARRASSDAIDVLAEGSWGVDQLAGRRIVGQFVPTIEPQTMLQLRMADVRSFVPVLAVEGADLAPEEAASLTARGDAITLDGQRFAEGEDGTIVADDGAVLGVGDPEALARVASVELRADASAFPLIELEATALDSAGRQIPGIGADAFEVSEGEVHKAAVMSRNQVPPPRIALVVDDSGSIPEEFRGEARTELVLSLFDTLSTSHPGTQFAVSFIGDDDVSPWTSDRTAVRGAIESGYGYGSDIFTAVAAASDAAPTAILLISDADPTDELTPQLRTSIATGAPVFTVGVATVNEAVADQLSELSGGDWAPAADSDEAIAAASAYLESHPQATYAFRYQTTGDGPSRRTVTMTVGGVHRASAAYDLPPADQRGFVGAYAGLYLEIDYGGDTVRRTIAGASDDPYQEIDQDDLDQVEAAFFGRVVLSVEGAAPTLAHMLDELIDNQLDWLEVSRRTRDGGADAFIAALRDGVSELPEGLLSLQTPLPSAATLDTLTFETAPRFIASFERPIYGVGHERRVDILPFSRWATIADDPQRAWRLTAARSLHLAFVEAALHDAATVSQLDGVELMAAPAYQVDDLVPDELSDAWYQLMQPYAYDYVAYVPRSGTPLTAIVIDPDTGSALALLADGSGGGSSTVEEDLERLSRFYDVLGAISALAGLHPTVGAWIAISKFVLSVAILANAIIKLPPDPNAPPIPDDLIDDLLDDLACDAGKNALGGLLPQLLGDALGGLVSDVDTLDALVGAATGESLIPCPL